MARPNQEEIETFMSITGVSEATAIQKLEEHGGSLNEAVNAHFNQGDINRVHPAPVSAAPHEDDMEIDDPITEEFHRPPFSVFSSSRTPNAFSLLDPSFTRSMFDTDLTSRAPFVSHPRQVREIPIEVKDGDGQSGHSRNAPVIEDVTDADQTQGPETRGTVIIDEDDDDDEVIPGPLATRAVRRDRTNDDIFGGDSTAVFSGPSAPGGDVLPDYANDIEEEMVRAAIEASRRDAEMSTQQFDVNSQDLSDSRPQPRESHLEDAELARAVSLSLKAAEQEKAMHEGSKAIPESEGYKPAEENEHGKSTISNGRSEVGSSSIQDEAEDLEEEPLVWRRRKLISSGSETAQDVEERVVSPLSSPRQNLNHSPRNGADFQSDEWGGMSSLEHDEAVMLEAAIFGGIPEGTGYRKRSLVNHTPIYLSTTIIFSAQLPHITLTSRRRSPSHLSHNGFPSAANMAPPKSVRSMSQQAFDELVKENIEDLGMDSTEALEDAIQTLTLQGVDLSGIVTSILGSGEENPVIQSLEKLKELDRDCKQGDGDETDVKEITEWLDKLNDACHVDGSGNAAIATKNGAIELVCSICGKLGSEGLVSSLKTLVSLLHDLQSTEIFREINGPKMVMNILNNRKENISILNSGFTVVSAAATGNEVLKEAFMNFKIDELILQCLREFNRGSIPCLYDAVQVLLTSDDNRVVASEVYGYARRFAKIGIVEALVDSLHDGIKAPSLVSASVALKAIAVNDEICRAVAENGGIDAILRCIDDSSEQGEKVVAITCCSLLSKLAGSDINKSAIVDKDGMNKLMKLATRFSDDPAVLHEVMSMITVLSLRSPHNAACAIEAGAGDIVIQAMQRFPESELLQRSCCFMIRNLVVRNPENRTILLGNGIEKLIRKAKMNYKSCKNAATDALRDLGLDNYNL